MVNRTRKLLPLTLLVSLFFVTQSAKALPLLDIMVLMDASSSLSATDYQAQKDAVQGFMDSLTISESAARFGLVQYATTVQTLSSLSGAPTGLNSALVNAGQLFGQTNHGGAFAAASNELSINGRSSAQSLVILITDGAANEPSGGSTNPILDAIIQSENLKADGALVATIGVGGGVDQQDLEDYSSGNEYSVLIPDFTFLPNAFNSILDELPQSDPPSSVVEPPATLLISLALVGLSVLRRRSRLQPRHSRAK